MMRRQSSSRELLLRRGGPGEIPPSREFLVDLGKVRLAPVQLHRLEGDGIHRPRLEDRPAVDEADRLAAGDRVDFGDVGVPVACAFGPVPAAVGLREPRARVVGGVLEVAAVAAGAAGRFWKCRARARGTGA